MIRILERELGLYGTDKHEPMQRIHNQALKQAIDNDDAQSTLAILNKIGLNGCCVSIYPFISSKIAIAIILANLHSW